MLYIEGGGGIPRRCVEPHGRTCTRLSPHFLDRNTLQTFFVTTEAWSYYMLNGDKVLQQNAAYGQGDKDGRGGCHGDLLLVHIPSITKILVLLEFKSSFGTLNMLPPPIILKTLVEFLQLMLYSGSVACQHGPHR